MFIIKITATHVVQGCCTDSQPGARLGGGTDLSRVSEPARLLASPYDDKLRCITTIIIIVPLILLAVYKWHVKHKKYNKTN